MPLVETEGLVLKTYNLAEADRIVLFLTYEHGLVRGVAKGAKRLKSKFGSSLEPYSVVRLSYFQKDAVELVSVQNVELLRSHFSMVTDPDVLHRFAYLGDLLTAITAPGDPNEDLYRMVRACLDAASKGRDVLNQISLYFKIWLLKLGGYLPEWTVCSNCRRTFDPDEPAVLLANFQLICGLCKRINGPVATGNMRHVLAAALKLAPTRFVETISGKDEEIREVSDVLRRIFATITGREVAAERSALVRY